MGVPDAYVSVYLPILPQAIPVFDNLQLLFGMLGSLDSG
jgi:hypothetical protein